MTTSAFLLPDRLAAKADPDLIGDDDRHFALIASSLSRSLAELSDRRDAVRRQPGGSGQDALERDLEIHRLSARLRALGRYGLDLCLGRCVGDGETVYIGRFGLRDADGRRLLVDWRSPAAEPFFRATLATPMGLSTRRRYRWTNGRVSDYWDEVFDGSEAGAAIDDQSAFIASLGSSRSPRMRDVLGTIQADQDAIIRAGSRGALVVDGGPGTGKTVVALHRTAYLIYSDPRLEHRRGGVLLVGPHPAYLAYVADVLPSLGEDGVQVATLRDLVPEGAAASAETDPAKSSLDATALIEAAVRAYERPPRTGMTVATDWADVWLGPDDWAEAFDAAEPGVAHNEARDEVWDELVTILVDRHGEEVPSGVLRRAIQRDEDLRAAFARAWPLLDPVGVVADLFAAPGALHRADPRAWTVSDLPLLDAARHRIGDPGAARERRRREVAIATQRDEMATVIEDLIAAEVHDDGEGLMSMLRGQDLQNSLVDESALPSIPSDQLAGPFAHIVVDEAQELTDAEWQMLLRRCPSRSFTIVGDRAQARHGFAESWVERLRRIGLNDVTVASLSVNYRTPTEVMAEAEPVIRAALPDANVPVSVRSTGIPVRHASVSALDSILEGWLATHADGIAAVIGLPSFGGMPRVRSLTPAGSKGLEFDLVVLVEPERFGDGIEGAVDRYVAMTRATQQLVVLAG